WGGLPGGRSRFANSFTSCSSRKSNWPWRTTFFIRPSFTNWRTRIGDTPQMSAASLVVTYFPIAILITCKYIRGDRFFNRQNDRGCHWAGTRNVSPRLSPAPVALKVRVYPTGSPQVFEGTAFVGVMRRGHSSTGCRLKPHHWQGLPNAWGF